MWRKTRVLLAVLCSAAACSPSPEPREVRELARPNILLLTAEDMSPRVGAFGDAVALTPRLDQLAAEGVRFPNTFTTAGVCAPSRAAQITGMHQNAVGAGHMRTSSGGPIAYTAVPPPNVKAYPELLRAAGYYTFNSGKTDYGFAESPMAGSGPRTIWDADELSAANDWRSGPPDRPFFGMINFGITHESNLFPLDSWPKNVMHALMLPLLLWQQWGLEPVTDPADVILPAYYPDTPLVRRTVARQYDNIHHMDRQVGDLLDRLEADGLADSTIVIWTTDHGSGLPASKRELTDGGLRVPMIIRWPERFRPPNLAPGSADERLVSFVDLAPQILSWAGVEPGEWMVGSAFAGPQAAAPREYVYAARDRLDNASDRSRAVRDASFKYIRNDFPDKPRGQEIPFRETIDMMAEWRGLFDAGELSWAQARWFEPRGKEELYHLPSDPFEVHNLVTDPAHGETLTRLRGALDAWLASHDDQGAVAEEELVARFYPDGTQPETASPEINFSGNAGAIVVELSSATPGASLSYRRSGAGRPEHWELYTEPFAVNPGEQVEAIAVRYGWSESDATEATVPSR